MGSSIPDVDQYWPEVANDLSKVTWSHATNSKALLQEALTNDTIMMIEADISMGHLQGNLSTDPLPIMAHPPHKTSDLSFEMFLDTVLVATAQNETKKGIKLDFKDVNAVRKCLDSLNIQRDQINFPVWLNADIISGPVDAVNTPVDPDTFLPLCVEFFPEGTLSVGWTTRFTEANDSRAHYTTDQVKQMTDAIERNHVTQPITFPVRAAFVELSLDILSWLLDAVPDSTLTVWSSESDEYNIEALVWLQDSVGADAVYYDLPPDQRAEFDKLRPAQTLGSASSADPCVKIWPRGTVLWASLTAALGAVAAAYFYGFD
ncbi:protein FAM151B isoform X2 [Hyalella azteca]|nr:protein FAM151B isoform X2 [Hyalella azteca]XP_018020189.1 protein FAM151B isoform X2 [Hyalella azteca]XP_018020191.1 protein FAM151B isoform X2 [Hyalella azteca]